MNLCMWLPAGPALQQLAVGGILKSNVLVFTPPREPLQEYPMYNSCRAEMRQG